MALCALQPMGNPELAELVESDGASEVWAAVCRMGEASPWGRKSQRVDAAQLEAATRACSARFLIPDDDEWPPDLAALDRVRVGSQGAAPLGLWVRGPLALGELGGAVAIVGARASTAYGSHVATDMAAEVALEGRVVVSGLAYGIDGAAHRGALSVRRPTVAVLASGVDTPYPTAHTRLLDAVAASGAVLSEVPPGATPMKASFLARNRVIAALSAGVVVVEAAARSGARNTAAWGGELGRLVMAVPGPVTSSMSATPHRLIREAEAVLVTSGAEVHALLSPLSPQGELPLRGEDQPLDRLSPELRSIREAFRPREALGVGDISQLTGQSIPDCLAGVDELVELGWLEESGPQAWRLPRRPVTARRGT